MPGATSLRELAAEAAAETPSRQLYDRGFLAWTQEQAEALRRRDVDGIDWDNVIEEVETLGRSEEQAWTSYRTNVVPHLLRIEHYRSPESLHHGHGEVVDWRVEMCNKLEENPRMRHELPVFLGKAWKRGREKAVIAMARYDAPADVAAQNRRAKGCLRTARTPSRTSPATTPMSRTSGRGSTSGRLPWRRRSTRRWRPTTPSGTARRGAVPDGLAERSCRWPRHPVPGRAGLFPPEATPDRFLRFAVCNPMKIKPSGLGRSGIWLQGRVQEEGSWVEIAILGPDDEPELTGEWFHGLEGQKTDIESELGFELDWRAQQDRPICSIRHVWPDSCGWAEASGWDAQHSRMAGSLRGPGFRTYMAFS